MLLSPAAKLLPWYHQHRRDLPWRRTRDPYRIWLAEVMLQQTTVAAVVPHHRRFLRLFPTVRRLAAAAEDEVLAAWSGLGYYSRARNLLRAARVVVGDHAGRFPRSAAALRELPGFGPYTAAAVASIAFGERAAVVDGNVVRVVARLLALDGHARAPALAARVRVAVDDWIPPAAPGDFNQALMELGALVCRPKAPDCPACPLAASCRSLRDGRAAMRPAPPPRRPVERIALAAGLVLDDGAVLLRRRRDQPFLDGLWELPSVPVAAGDDAARALRAELRRLDLGRFTLADTGVRVRQAITYRRVELDVFAVRLPSERSPAGVAESAADVAWHRLGRPESLPLPALFRKAVVAATGLAAAPRRPRP